MPTEERLIRKLKKGSESAFLELYNKYSGRLFGVCLRYSKNSADAEDLLQDSFVKIFENIKNYKGTGSFEGWLRRITVNNCINFYRKTVNNKEVSSDEYQIDDVVEENVFSKLMADDILELIQELPEGYRIVFNLYAIEGYKHNEIADMLGFTESTSKTQFFKAKKILVEKVLKKYPNLVEQVEIPGKKNETKLVLK